LPAAADQESAVLTCLINGLVPQPGYSRRQPPLPIGNNNANLFSAGIPVQKMQVLLQTGDSWCCCADVSGPEIYLKKLFSCILIVKRNSVGLLSVW
jgi:hypothetical protein